MIVLRLLGRNCPEPWPARRSASSQGATTAARSQACKHAQPLTARTPWYGEGNSKTAYTPPNAHTRLWQAERAGPRGPKASGVKAGWPRFGTKRGAQPANPTAARRDARMLLSGLLARLPLLDLQPRPLGRLLQLLAQHRTRRQAGQVLGNVDARLVQFQQFDLLALLASAKNDPQR